MAPNLKILDSDGITEFTSQNFGTVVAGSVTIPKLVFVDSYGTTTASGSEFGFVAVGGNDGINYAQMSSATTFDASGTGISGTVTSTGGTISGTLNIVYKISAKDNYGHESAINASTSFIPTLSGTNTNQVAVAWDAIPNATFYGLYLSVDSGTSFKLVTYTTILSYTDTSGTATATSPQASGTFAYKPSTWSVVPLAVGDMVSGTLFPCFFRENVPSGTSSIGNTRQHNIYAQFINI